jgi:hypothetical protein
MELTADYWFPTSLKEYTTPFIELRIDTLYRFKYSTNNLFPFIFIVFLI